METTDYNITKNNSSRNIIFRIIGTIIAIAILYFCMFSIVTYAYTYEEIRTSKPYKEGMKRLKSDATVIEALGSPIEPGLFIMGSIDHSSADFTVPVSGPKGKGTLYVRATRDYLTWIYFTIAVAVDGGETINIDSSYKP